MTETTDGNFYQKKVVGPGFVTVVTSSSSANMMAGSPNEAIKELVNAMLGMVGQINEHIAVAGEMLNGDGDNSHALAVPKNTGGFLVAEEPHPESPIAEVPVKEALEGKRVLNETE